MIFFKKYLESLTMARKRRTSKTAARRINRKKSDSDQNSNSVSDDNEVDSKQDSNTDDNQNTSQSSSSEKNHKHLGKFRYLERRHSSSQDEECEDNTCCDLMPQEIQNIVLGDGVKTVIVNSHRENEDEVLYDTCLRGVVEHEIVYPLTEYEPSEVSFSVEVETSERDIRTEVIEESSDSTYLPSVIESSDLVKSFEKTVQINETLNNPVHKSDEEFNPACDTISVNEEIKLIGVDSTNESKSSEKCSDESKVMDIVEESKKSEEETKGNLTEEPRRRSNRIRVNRWTDDESKTTIPSEVQVTPPPPPTSLFDSDKPVKVKSRWRRTSELEMGGTTGSVTSDSELSTVTTISLTSPEIPPSMDPEVEEGLKSFEIISHNVFLTPRIKSKEKEIKKMMCDCTLSKEEMAKGEMGCGEDCLNRLLMIECGIRCVLGNYCSNRRFQNCQYTPCQVIKTKRKGLGLITTVSVGAGTFLMEYVGEVLDSKEFRRRAKEYAKGKISHFYFMYLKGHTIIDATIRGNISRFINHSCDPNSETQKWTVNGELRIGFFSKRPISAGEEITFDYKLDRYGKEAQKCFCESSNCRGWIGETPDGGEKEKEKKDSGSRKERKEKKRKEEKRRDFMSDRELEEEIEKLAATGVKNQKHTLTLSRLMVRAEEDSSRKQLLEIAQTADIRCLRLLLDYHGLSLLWSWMLDNRSSPELRMEILNTLSVLPVANRTVLQDSKVLNVVQKWANVTEDTTDSKDSLEMETGEDSSPGDSERIELPEKIVEKNEEMEKNIVAKASELLNSWSNLKQEFRIPKKERIEQMKEHEREADRGYYSDPRENQSYDRHWNYEKENRNYEKESRYSTSNNHRERKRGRESPSESSVGEWRKSRMQQEERHNGGMNRLSKTERRQLFAMKVEEEERQRKMEEWAKQHAQMLGPPAPTPPQMDPNQGYYQQPPFHPPSDGAEIVFGGCPPAFPPPFLGPPQPPPAYMEGPPSFSNPPPSGPPPGGFHPPPFTHPPIAPPYQPPLPAYPPFSYNPPPQQVYPPTPALPAPPVQAPSLPGSAVPLTTPPPSQVPLTSAPPPVPLVSAPPPLLNNPPVPNAPPPAASLSSTPSPVISLTTAPPPPPPPVARVFPIKLPPKWRSAKDKEGRIYYYHAKTRKSQWQIPTEDSVPPHLSDSDSDSEESSDDDDSTTEEEEEEKEFEEDEDGFDEEENVKKDDDDVEYTPEDLRLEDIPAPVPIVAATPPVLKKRREGLVQVNIISPRDDEDDYRCGIKKKQIRETKERLAKEKKKLRSGGAAKCEADTSGGPRRRIKDLFRVQMANVVVALLNPYRKSDCKIARITNTEDFKHLARKLTHFVMVKELKHCSSVEELECNDNVKHKARDFIRKYMSKFGPIYKRSPDE